MNDALSVFSAQQASDFDRGAAAHRLVVQRSAWMDEQLTDLWRTHQLHDAPLALLATGGYGRGELYPYSDVDVLLLVLEPLTEVQQQQVSVWLAALWDMGLTVGHAMRNLNECVEAGKADIATATAMLEARYLTGNDTALQQLQSRLAPEHVWSSAAYFEAKKNEQMVRHGRFHDTSHNLEPNIKEAPGGLRDIHVLLWLAQRTLGTSAWSRLVAVGVLGDDELHTLIRASQALSKLRFGLHLVVGRGEDRLLFDHQKALAKRLGFNDDGVPNQGVEAMMQGYYRTADVVQRLNERLLQRFEEILLGVQAVTVVDDAFEWHGTRLALRHGQSFAAQPAFIFRLFLLLGDAGRSVLHSETARQLGESLDIIDESFRHDESHIEAFKQLLRHPNAVHLLALMAKSGVLARWIPEFGLVSGRMQFDLFHVYTVDQHTLAVLGHVQRMLQGRAGDLFAHAHTVVPKLSDPVLLVLAALFHDIGKGRGGDHAVVGAEDARRFCVRLGLSESDVVMVSWLVAQHLLMSQTAQRKDISDPEVVADFARVVGNRRRLAYLYLLTIADIAGTSPKLWNSWKDRLFSDLFVATRVALRSGLEHHEFAAARIEQHKLQTQALLSSEAWASSEMQRLWASLPDESFLRYAPEQLVWQIESILDTQTLPCVAVRAHRQGDAFEVFVHAKDQQGLLANVAVSIDRAQLVIAEARIVTSADGFSLNTFRVVNAHTGTDDPKQRAKNITQSVRDALQTGWQPPAQRMLPRRMKAFHVPIRVAFQTILSSEKTQMTLICSDRPGLLAHVSELLWRQQINVHDARIATYGERAEDFFTLTNAQGKPLDEPEQATLHDALTEVLSGL